MQDLLRALSAIDAVTGCWVYDAQGLVTASDLPAVYNQQILTDNTQLVTRATESFEFHYGAWSSFIIEYAEGVMIVHNLAPGGLIILATLEVNLAQLGVAASVAVKKIQSRLEAPTEPALATATSSPRAQLSSGSGVRTATSRSEEAVGSSAALLGNEPAASEAFMRELNNALAEYMGPASAILIKRSLKRMGLPSSRLPVTMVRPLVDELERQIPRVADRMRFSEAVHKMIRFHQIS